jgi:hypothetical protein
MQICTQCHQEKSIKHFRTQRRKRVKVGEDFDYINPMCRDCENQRNRERYHKGGKDKWAEARKKWSVKYSYGLTGEELDALYEKQNGKCKICTTDLVMVGKNANNIVSVDHCHDTGKVRGLLCRQCNAGLGQFRDDPELLKKAVDYLDHS